MPESEAQRFKTTKYVISVQTSNEALRLSHSAEVWMKR